jgi:hypothetical protein
MVRGSLTDAVIHICGLECIQDFQQCRLVKGHRALCPFASTIGVVPLTIARWPLWREHLRHSDPCCLHHSVGRYSRPCTPHLSVVPLPSTRTVQIQHTTAPRTSLVAKCSATRSLPPAATSPASRELIAAIGRFCYGGNRRCQPFDWTKDADQLLAKLKPAHGHGRSGRPGATPGRPHGSRCAPGPRWPSPHPR